MPSPRIDKIPLVQAPASWKLPNGIEVRMGVPEGGSAAVVAFRNPRSREACAAMAELVDFDEPLPSWLIARIMVLV